MGLDSGLELLARELAQRELAHTEALASARERAEELRAIVARAIDRFHVGLAEAGGSPIAVEVSPVRPDDKHLRSCQFDLGRGRYHAIVTVKSRGEVTLVGPFRVGKAEGPCRSFPLSSSEEFEHALTDFVVAFLEDASTP